MKFCLDFALRSTPAVLTALVKRWACFGLQVKSECGMTRDSPIMIVKVLRSHASHSTETESKCIREHVSIIRACDIGGAKVNGSPFLTPYVL
ncbi:hypothetical protein M404DRAFT_1005622 [Pisolithus tinctorius Marx 270]|uniref:Uncharacterized protein n=1 Tax=Pisolithus tinctorius Marx 270 TaxID=870435 RepID=A0A0C3IMC3_PISTI|nr:hypothetical protein M404DRAFT_1005622 [Pisolithus tinctorius Marx 270]